MHSESLSVEKSCSSAPCDWVDSECSLKGIDGIATRCCVDTKQGYTFPRVWTQHCWTTNTETLAKRPGFTMVMGSRPMTHQGLWRTWVIHKAKGEPFFCVRRRSVWKMDPGCVRKWTEMQTSEEQQHTEYWRCVLEEESELSYLFFRTLAVWSEWVTLTEEHSF